MSINAKVDNQTYEGINSISVGGKTINLEEISSSSGVTSMATGTFTPESNTEEFNVNTELENISGFIIQMETTKLDSGTRALGFISVICSTNKYSNISTNVDGTSMSAPSLNTTINNSSDTSPHITYENGTINISNLTVNNIGLFVQTQYRWYAW